MIVRIDQQNITSTIKWQECDSNRPHQPAACQIIKITLHSMNTRIVQIKWSCIDFECQTRQLNCYLIGRCLPLFRCRGFAKENYIFLNCQSYITGIYSPLHEGKYDTVKFNVMPQVQPYTIKGNYCHVRESKVRKRHKRLSFSV